MNSAEAVFPPFRTSSRGMKLNSALDSIEGAAVVGTGSVKSQIRNHIGPQRPLDLDLINHRKESRPIKSILDMPDQRERDASEHENKQNQQMVKEEVLKSPNLSVRQRNILESVRKRNNTLDILADPNDDNNDNPSLSHRSPRSLNSRDIERSQTRFSQHVKPSIDLNSRQDSAESQSIAKTVKKLGSNSSLQTISLIIPPITSQKKSSFSRMKQEMQRRNKTDSNIYTGPTEQI